MIKNEALLVSVIIPVYNGEQFLTEALDSVVQQAYRPLEIIVVDDGSTDETAALVQRYASDCDISLHYVYQENQGPAAARNHGLQIARGEIIAFQDADDIWTDIKLEKQLDLLRRFPDYDIVMGHIQYVERSAAGDLVSCPEPYALPMLSLMFQSALFRRAVFDSVGWLNENMWSGEDVDWYLRAFENNINAFTHQDVVLLYRRHDANLTNDRQNTDHHFFLAMKRSLNRRRNSSTAGAIVSLQAGMRSIVPDEA